MEIKEKRKENKAEDEKLWCEKFKEYVSQKKGCQHLQGYCPYRNRCILFLLQKFEDI
jgi:hypothetical protein